MITVRHGEIYTKSPPVRRQFIARLVDNIRKAVSGRVAGKRWRVLVYPKNEKKAVESLKKVPGIVSFSICIETEADLKSIEKAVSSLLPRFRKKTFAVRAQRLSKELMESQKINEIMGDFIRKKARTRVDLSNPQITLGIEIYDGKAFVFTETHRGMGGLPLGTAGKMVLLKSKNSKAAGWMMSRRGIELVSKAKSPLGVITGETDLKKIMLIYKKYGRRMPLYAPLIGLNKKELEKIKG
jgi:thiamine biosynthesis protein ThiI